MTSFQFSPDTKRALYQSGWYEDRSISTIEYEEALRNDGYPVPPVLLDFLKKFGGIRICFALKYRPDISKDIEIDPIIAIGEGDRETIEQYSERVGTPLCIFGIANRRYLFLMMASDGTVYAGYDEMLLKVAPSGPEAIEALVSARDLPKVP